ncbi:hypothetical protein NYE65_09000 [Peribacillus sp. FSL R5-0717]|uniref:hypothetical protein n=1 Tax=Peribacillus sp. FSL R5-0717 TaxID=2975308 RepID=UPI0030FC2E27
MLEKGKIGSRQLLILVILYTLGDSILVLPSVVAFEAEQDAWSKPRRAAMRTTLIKRIMIT